MNLRKNIVKFAMAGSVALAFTACSSDESSPTNPGLQQPTVGEQTVPGEVVDPNAPATDPNVPSVDVPVVDTNTPVVDPSTPTVDVPVATPNTPTVEPTTPADPTPSTPAEPDAPSASAGFELWDGSTGEVSQVPTGNAEGGYWYSYNDNESKGASKLTWGAAVGDEYSESSMAPVIKECGGLCGEFSLDKADYEYGPFVGFGFNFGAADDDVVDVTASKGLCVAYQSDYEIVIELGLGSTVDKAIGYANPAYPLSESATETVADISWDDFSQPSWASKTVDDPAKALASLKFKFTSNDGGETGKFKITKVGPKGTCK